MNDIRLVRRAILQWQKQRDKTILSLKKKGWSITGIAARMNVSRQRVQQILKRLAQ